MAYNEDSANCKESHVSNNPVNRLICAAVSARELLHELIRTSASNDQADTADEVCAELEQAIAAAREGAARLPPTDSDALQTAVDTVLACASAFIDDPTLHTSGPGDRDVRTERRNALELAAPLLRSSPRILKLLDGSRDLLTEAIDVHIWGDEAPSDPSQCNYHVARDEIASTLSNLLPLRFRAVWGPGFVTEETREVSVANFTGENGYSTADIQAILALAPGQTWQSSDHPTHTVTRL